MILLPHGIGPEPHEWSEQDIVIGRMELPEGAEFLRGSQ